MYTLIAKNASGVSVTATATVTVTAPTLTYTTDIQPILNGAKAPQCVYCHSGPFPSAGRDLTTYGGVMTVVVAGDPNSRLIQMTQIGGAMRGYLTNPTTDAQTIYNWVMAGAKQ
jgi:hypothetical protein